MDVGADLPGKHIEAARLWHASVNLKDVFCGAVFCCSWGIALSVWNELCRVE